MLNNYSIIENKKDEMIKLYAWLAYDVFLAGLLTYNWVVLNVQNMTTLDAIEKFILFLCTVCFAVYRIYHLHLDGVRKRIQIRKMKEAKGLKKAG